MIRIATGSNKLSLSFSFGRVPRNLSAEIVWDGISITHASEPFLKFLLVCAEFGLTVFFKTMSFIVPSYLSRKHSFFDSAACSLETPKIFAKENYCTLSFKDYFQRNWPSVCYPASELAA